MADKWQGEATRSIRAWGFNSYKPPDFSFNKYGQNRFQEIPGRPDLMVWRGGRMVFVEVKDATTAFPFANFEQSKRDYAAKYCLIPPYTTDVWLWLCMGMGNPNSKPDKNPRLTWLLPIKEWYAVEAKVKPYQVSLPYLAGKGYSLELQQRKLDAVHLLQRFVLSWKGAQTWAIAPEHPFYKMYIKPEPIPLYKEENQPYEQQRPNLATTGSKQGHYGSSRYLDYRVRGNDARHGLPRESILYSGSDASLANPEYQDYSSHALLRLAGVV